MRITIESIQIQTPPIGCDVANCAEDARCRLHYNNAGFIQNFIFCMYHTRATIAEALVNLDD